MTRYVLYAAKTYTKVYVERIMFETKEVFSGGKAIQGKFVPIPGKNKGLIVLRHIATYFGTPFDKIEIKEVFKTKKGPWHVQCTGSKGSRKGVDGKMEPDQDKTTRYGYPKAIGFPHEVLFNLIECLNEMYVEIYGDTAPGLPKITVSEGEKGKVTGAPASVMDELKKYGF